MITNPLPLHPSQNKNPAFKFQLVIIQSFLSTVISSKKLFKMASKWEIFAVIKRKGISLPNNEAGLVNGTAQLAYKGHFVVYTTDQARFMIPLEYLSKRIFRELLKLSEEEFGLEIDGPITLPCDASFMEYVILFLQRGGDKNVETFLLMSVVTSCDSSQSLFHEEQTEQQLFISTP